MGKIATGKRPSLGLPLFAARFQSRRGAEALYDALLGHLTRAFLGALPFNARPVADSRLLFSFRIIVSDGQHFMQGMLSTSLNGIASSGEFDKMVVVKVDQYACNNVQNRKCVDASKTATATSPD